MSLTADLAEARSQTRRFGYDSAFPQGGTKMSFSTLLNTLNRSKSVIYVLYLCRATAKVTMIALIKSPLCQDTVPY
jgi:hypothetical protein